MAENINADTSNIETVVRKPIITKTKEQFELTDLSTGNYFVYDIKNDFLSVNTKGKLVILEGREDKIKELLKDKIINGIQSKELEQQKEIEIKQVEIAISIKKRLTENNYTPHSHFKDIASWEDDNFDNFIKQFNKKEIILLKNNLSDNIKTFEDRAISGNSMNSELDNIGSRHRTILDKIEKASPTHIDVERNTRNNRI